MYFKVKINTYLPSDAMLVKMPTKMFVQKADWLESIFYFTI